MWELKTEEEEKNTEKWLWLFVMFNWSWLVGRRCEQRQHVTKVQVCWLTVSNLLQHDGICCRSQSLISLNGNSYSLGGPVALSYESISECSRVWTGNSPHGKDLSQFWLWSHSRVFSLHILTQNTPGSLSKPQDRKQSTCQVSNVSCSSLPTSEWRIGVSASVPSPLDLVQLKTVLWPIRENQRTLMQFFFMQGTSKNRLGLWSFIS